MDPLIVYDKLLSIKNFKPTQSHPIVYDTHEEKLVKGGNGVYKVIHEDVKGGSPDNNVKLVYYET